MIYTSGVWGTRPRPAAWIGDVLERTSTVFLSTDAFHQEGVPDSTYVNAARAIAASDAWIVVQVIDTAPMVERAARASAQAFGERYEDFAELRADRAADRRPRRRRLHARDAHARPRVRALHDARLADRPLRRAGHGVLQRGRDHGLRPGDDCAAGQAPGRGRRGDGRVPHRPDAARRSAA